jgi:dUTP pyrophosphatase
MCRLSKTAVAPSRASAGAAGYDLSSSQDIIVPAHGKAIVPTDIIIALPPGTYGRIAPRSGFSWKNHIGINKMFIYSLKG